MKMVAALLLISGIVFTTASLAASNVKVETFATGLVHPWSIAFLPEGHSLVTERPGRMRVVSPHGALSQPITGLPDVFASQTLGLLDVAVAHDFPTSHTIYFCYSHLKQQDGFTFSVVTVATAQLEAFDGPSPALRSQKILFEQTPVIADDYGVLGGCRIVLQSDYLFAALGAGDRMSMLPELLDNTFGKVVRIHTTARSRPTIPSLALLQQSRRSGPSAIAIPRAWRLMPMDSSGSRSMARKAATRSTVSRRGPTTAGRSSATG